MASIYKGDHSVMFLTDADMATLKQTGYKVRHTDSWDDWYLIPTSRPDIQAPKTKSKPIDIPGMDGVIDASEWLGPIRFSNRQGQLQFVVDNGHADWMRLKSLITSKLHGRSMKMILKDDLEFYYKGRFTFDQWKSDKKRSSVVIGYDISPYKYKVIGTDEEWLWDPFNFRTGVIQRYKNIEVSGTKTVKCISGREQRSPTITVTAPMTVSLNGGTAVSLTTGANYVGSIVLNEGENTLTFTGTGTITSIKYEGGYL